MFPHLTLFKKSKTQNKIYRITKDKFTKKSAEKNVPNYLSNHGTPDKRYSTIVVERAQGHDKIKVHVELAISDYSCSHVNLKVGQPLRIMF